MDVRDGNEIEKVMDACLPIRCQVANIHGWNPQRFQCCLLFGDQTVPGGDDALGVEPV